jgi:3-hydroxyacyl-CoA dehydrogenase
VALNKLVRRIAIVRTGLIGSRWAAQYLARGFDVIATDPFFLEPSEVTICD